MVANLTVLNNSSALKGSPSFNPNGCNPNAKCGNGLEKIYPTCAVRYGYMNYIGEFRYAPGMLFGCGAKVVIQTARGIEIGQQVSLTCTGCDKSVRRQSMLDYVKNSGPDFYRLKSGRILREATPQDIEEQKHLDDGVKEKMHRARELSREMNLEMKFVACEHLLGGERIIFHFMAEGRIDFREFVRTLAHEYHTRIEMHQVGARDEARLVADYEICGRECCCKSFLKTLRPVTMRMAKLQKATLDPSKVSGRCGRLRCCLRYEHEGYEELDKKLPKIGNRVRTDRGVGSVKDRQILTQLVTIQYDADDTIETVGIEDVLERNLAQRDPSQIRPPEGRSDRPPDRRERRRPEPRRDERERAPAEAVDTHEKSEPPTESFDAGIEDSSGGEGQSVPPESAERPARAENMSEEQFGGRRRRGRRRGRRGRRGPFGGPPGGDGSSGGDPEPGGPPPPAGP
ncbi:MAG: hypothetical protein DCC65_04960 [Planctomycetota bacterium]|nr:MAG: hypothetical protein DCC65_04960 [Planctomycetota bacterium]